MDRKRDKRLEEAGGGGGGDRFAIQDEMVRGRVSVCVCVSVCVRETGVCAGETNKVKKRIV